MKLVALLLGVAALPAAALDFCPSVGKVEMPAGKKDPCEGLAFFAGITARCAAEIAEDRNLQRHAAGVLELERQTKIDDSVLRSLRAMRANPDQLGGRKVDPVAFDRQVAMQESYGAKNRAALEEKRALAASAGYPRLAEAGYAQAVITNAVWRYLDGAVRPQLANCGAGEAGRKAAGDFAGMLAVSMSHGNPIETHIIRQLLGK